MILSNATFQWFENLKEAIKNLADHLSEQGEIYFSIFAEKTFQELRNSIKSVMGRDSYSQRFFSKFQLEQMFNSEFSQVEIIEEEYLEYFSSLMDFLKSIKRIGANSANQDKAPLTPRLLKRIEEEYKAEYYKDGQLVVTHHLLFVRLRK